MDRAMFPQASLWLYGEEVVIGKQRMDPCEEVGSNPTFPTEPYSQEAGSQQVTSM